jgi:predicted outer membrane lipoprotein
MILAVYKSVNFTCITINTKEVCLLLRAAAFGYLNSIAYKRIDVKYNDAISAQFAYFSLCMFVINI